MSAGGFPEGRLIETNGVRLRVHQAGEPGGTPVVLLHGFPELAYSWRGQLPALAAAGRWAVAPDQRGYGGSDAPRAVDAYGMEALTGDMAGMLDALGADRAIWVGHDWGGLAAWELARRFPGRTAGVVGLNTPFLPRTPEPPVTLIRRRFGPGHYISLLQIPALPELLFRAGGRRAFRRIMRRPGGRGRLLSGDELEVYAAAFRRSGFRGPINWYRNLDENWRRSAGLPEQVDAPALMITAELDPFLPPALAEGMQRYVPDLERAAIKGAGHWTQQEQPEAVNRILLDWLERRFPLGSGAEKP